MLADMLARLIIRTDFTSTDTERHIHDFSSPFYFFFYYYIYRFFLRKLEIEKPGSRKFYSSLFSFTFDGKITHFRKAVYIYDPILFKGKDNR